MDISLLDEIDVPLLNVVVRALLGGMGEGVALGRLVVAEDWDADEVDAGAERFECVIIGRFIVAIERAAIAALVVIAAGGCCSGTKSWSAPGPPSTCNTALAGP